MSLRIALDAMGSDGHPLPEIRGAIEAARRFGIEVLLVGPYELLEAELRRCGSAGEIEIRHAPEIVGMGERPAEALRRKPRSSMRVAMEALRAGDAAAVVSAGNSGALLLTAVTTLGRIRGVDRPAIAVELPTLSTPVLLTDAGANSSCRPSHLLDFARLGAAAATAMYGLDTPSVGLLSNGEESGKGTDLTRDAYALLRASELDFIGYVEPGDLAHGRTDVVVTDGFSGNLVLKTIEGTAQLTWTLLRRAFHDGLFPEMGYWLARRAMKRHLGDALDYQERGGAPLLGIDGLVIAAHGRSGARAITSALQQAARLSSLGFIPHVTAALDRRPRASVAAAKSALDHGSDCGQPSALSGTA